MGLNIGLYLQRSEGPIQKSKILVQKSEVLVWTFDQEETQGICLYKQETHVKDSPIALVNNHRQNQITTVVEPDDDRPRTRRRLP